MNLEQYEYDLKQEQKLETKKEYLVVKSNQLAQKTRYNLSLQEQKIMAFICSMIKPPTQSIDGYKNTFQLEYEFNIQEYCKVCGINYDSGKNYTDIKSSLKKLRDKSMWIRISEKQETLCSWLSKVKINEKSGNIKVRLDEDLIPYLFDLKERFVQYQLIHILGMKSSFSIRMYELLKSYSNLKRAEFDIDELKRILMVDNVKSYSDFGLFRKKVLEVALQEINDYTDIKVSFDKVKDGKKVVKVVFHIEAKNKAERYKALNQADYAIKLGKYFDFYQNNA